jgi:accessory gene regulator protein AgrB
MKPLALILAVVFLIIAVLYFLGRFVPAGVHVKHGIVSIVLALLCLVWYRFQSADGTAPR